MDIFCVIFIEVSFFFKAHSDMDASLTEMLHDASEADNFIKMAEKMAQLVVMTSILFTYNFF
jgi:hypothetical protein